MRKLLIGAVVIVFVSSLVIAHKSSEKPTFDSSMEKMGDWFISVQKNRGDFRYELSIPKGKTKRGNNIVRQAGALYGLAQLYKYDKNPNIQQTLEKGLGYFNKFMIPQGKNAVAVVFHGKLKSNASALLLLGLIEYLQAEPKAKAQYGERAEQLANYLVLSQTKEGGFINIWTPISVESDYNNGETFYALVRAYQVFHHPAYLRAAKKAAAYFETLYGHQKFNSAFYSWGMAGFAHLYKVEPRDEYWKFLKESTDKYWLARGEPMQRYINEKQGYPPKPGLAVFLEGVAHTAWIARDKNPEYYAKLKSHIESSLLFLMGYQVGNLYSPVQSKLARLQGGVCMQETCKRLRIDFTQHNLSALYLYQVMVKPGEIR